MAKMRLSEWKDRLTMVIRQHGDDIDFDDDLAANYWREGFSPEEFYREMVSGAHDPDDVFGVNTDFDPRYDM